MQITRLCRHSAAGFLLSVGVSGAASAATLEISITNNQAADGVYLTPLLSILHDGSYDAFDVGQKASTAVENAAEEGDVSGVEAEALAAGATTGVVTGPQGFGSMPGMPPVLDPGETGTLTLDVDPTSDRFFSFISMVIPSNDIFIANDNPMAYEVFDIAGEFTGLGPILVYSNEAWDAGTEENDGFGAPFNTAGGTATETDQVITPAPGQLFFLDGQTTAAGTTVNIPRGRHLLATIEISDVSEVPLPAGFPLLIGALGALGYLKRRKKG